MFTRVSFPVRWKRARLLLLHKGPDKLVTSSSSFRPLCMLDTVDKVYERILLLRLNEHLDKTSGLSANQFGFRRGCSTEDAINMVLDLAKWANHGLTRKKELCVLVALNVQNAFNFAPWKYVDGALQRRGVLHYLVNILLLYTYYKVSADGRSTIRPVTGGVPQGSVANVR